MPVPWIRGAGVLAPGVKFLYVMRHAKSSWKDPSVPDFERPKRDCGLARTRLDGIEGARTWCGHGVFAHNLVKISQLIPT
jgi:phosphohistidine phosphatase SixA